MSGKIDEWKQAGFTDQEISDYAVQYRREHEAAGFSDDEIDQYLTGNIAAPKTIPQPFIDRFDRGNIASRMIKSVSKGVMLGLNPSQPLGTLDPEVNKQLQDLGIFAKPGVADPLRVLNEAIIGPASVAIDAVNRGIAALGGGFGAAVSQAQEEITRPQDVGTEVSERSVEQGAEEGVAAFNTAALLLGAHTPVTRIGPSGDTQIGGLPKSEDFGNAAQVVAGEAKPLAVQQKLKNLYENQGYHPSEVAHDAASDVTITQSLLSKGPDVPYQTAELEKEAPLLVPEGTSQLGRPAPQPSESLPPSTDVNSAEFQRWFGNSKIVDSNGKPLIVYRGVANEGPFDSKRGVYYFSGDPDYAAGYAVKSVRANQVETGKVHEAYLSLQNPKIIGNPTEAEIAAARKTGDEWRLTASGLNQTDFIDAAQAKKLEEQGYDGVINYVHGNKGGPLPLNTVKEIIVFHPEQVRLIDKATDTEGGIPPAAAEILAKPEVKAMVETPNAIDRTHDVPYLAGSNNAGGTTFIDRRVPPTLDIDDKTIDPAKYLNVHEQTEHALMTEGGMSYEDAHKIATAQERAAVEADGINWKSYEAHMDGLLSNIEHENPENPPGDLYLKPYEHDKEKLAEMGAGGEKPPIEPPPPGTEMSPEDANDLIAQQISVGERQRTPFSLDRLYTEVFDRLFSISKATKELGGRELPAIDNPYKLARLMAGSAGRAIVQLEHHTFDFNTLEKTGPALKQILSSIQDQIGEFRNYVASSRALELENRGIKSGINIDAAAAVVKNAPKEFAKVADDLYAYQARILSQLRDSGILSDKAFDAIQDGNKFYVPYYRLFEEEIPKGRGKSFQPFNPVKRIKGSAKRIVDPLESVIRNTIAFTNLADRNAVASKMADLLLSAQEGISSEYEAVEQGVSKSLLNAVKGLVEKAGGSGSEDLAKELAAAVDEGAVDKFNYFKGGKKYSIQVDPELGRAMKGLNPEGMNWLFRVIGAPASTLRAGAVATPEFWGRHVFRDFFYALTTFKNGIFSPLDMARGLSGLITKDEDFLNWMKSGGGQVSLVSMDRRYLQESLEKLTGQTGLMTRAWNVVADPESSFAQRLGAVGGLPFKAINKYILNPARMLTEMAESASHLGAFKKSMRGLEPTKANVLEGGWTSRDTAVDVARRGASLQAYNLITAFANATIQDSDRVVRAFKDNPLRTTLMVTGGIALPSALLWAVNHNDSRYKQLPDWQKDLSWIILTDNWQKASPAEAKGRPTDQVRVIDGQTYVNNGTIWRLPKPFGMGVVFGTGTEKMLDAFYDHDSHAFDGFLRSVSEATVPSLLPTGIEPIVEQFANTSTYDGRTIIPDNLEGQLPEYQYTPYTTELAKRLGAILGAFPGINSAKTDPTVSMLNGTARALSSPILLENYVSAWSGTLGNYALDAADFALRKTGLLPDPPKPASALADIPVIKAFVVRYPSASAKSIQDFYDDYDKNQIYYNTWLARVKDGDVEAAQKVQAAGGPKMFVQLGNIRTALGTQSRLIQDITKNPQITPDEKRQLIDQIYFGMIQIAQTGNAILDRIPTK